MSVLRLSPSEYRAIVDGTDPVSSRHRFRAPLTRDVEPVADLPDEREFSLEDWQDERVEQVDMDPDDRSLVDEMPPGYCPRWWKATL